MSQKKKIVKPITAKTVKKTKTAKSIKTASKPEFKPKPTVAKTSAVKKQPLISKTKPTTKPKKPLGIEKGKTKVEVTKAGKSGKISAAEKEKLLIAARKKKVSTPSIFKIRSRKTTPIVFSLEDVQDILKKKPLEGQSVSKLTVKPPQKVVKKVPIRKVTQQLGKKDFKDFPPEPARVLGAASLADILGFNPKENKQPVNQEEAKVPKDLLKQYKALVALRERVLDGLALHSQDTLKRSSKEDSGDLSGYGQHMADAGTDTFDRDFALSLLSSEQDALFEIEEAVQRIINGTYGICEITGVPIGKERLKAVPFTRYSLEGQKQLEATQRLNKERGSVFPDAPIEETEKFTEDFEE